jgi:glutaredoxin
VRSRLALPGAVLLIAMLAGAAYDLPAQPAAAPGATGASRCAVAPSAEAAGPQADAAAAATCAAPGAGGPARETTAGEQAVPGTLRVFVREGCPHCADAKAFLTSLQREWPALRIEYRRVDADPAARDELLRISRAAGAWPPGVPTFVMGERVLVGFGDPAAAGAELRTFIAAAAWPPAASKREVDAGPFGTISVSGLGLPLFTLALGLLDGFNPCAMWVLLFLLSLLVHLRDRRRMALIAGTFVLVSGAVYYAFMAAWLNVFLAVGMSAALRIGLGALATLIGAVNLRDALGAEQGFVLSIPEGSKPGLYARMRNVMNARTLLPALAGVATLAVVVNFVELLCTAGFPAIYTAVLAQQELGRGAYYAYLGLYVLGYIADDAVMVTVAVIALGARRLTARAGRWLKLASGAVMLLLGVALILRPGLLV